MNQKNLKEILKMDFHELKNEVLNTVGIDIYHEDIFILNKIVGNKMVLELDYEKFSERIFITESHGGSDYEIGNLYLLRDKQIIACKVLGDKYPDKYEYHK